MTGLPARLHLKATETERKNLFPHFFSHPLPEKWERRKCNKLKWVCYQMFSQLANCDSNHAKPSGDTHAIFKNDKKQQRAFHHVVHNF